MKQVMANRKFIIYLGILGVFVAAAIVVPSLSPYSYDAQDVASQNLGVSVAHLFGTDKFGRDLFTRVFYGLRISLTVGFVSACVCFVIGVVVGAVSGLANLVVDSILLELMNIISAIPSMLYVILILLVLDASIGSVILGICVAGWVDLAKMVRVETRRLRQMDYCLAAEMMGVPMWRIIFKYILPNERGLLIVQTILLIPKAIFTEAFLSFLGIGIAAPRASLGTLIQDARSLITQYPTQILFPVLVLAALIVCLQSIGYALEQQGVNGAQRIQEEI